MQDQARYDMAPRDVGAILAARGETGDRDVMATEAEILAEAGARAATEMTFYRKLLLPHLLVLSQLSAPKNSGASATPPFTMVASHENH
jgi:hypothetical protein